MFRTIRIILLILLIFIAAVFVVKYPPAPQLTHTEVIRAPEITVESGDGTSIETRAGSYSWKTKTTAVAADSPAPSELAKDMRAYEAKQGEVLNYKFYYAPSITTIRFWQGKDVIYSTSGNGTITVPAFGGEYTVEVYAQWMEGRASYAFKLDVDSTQAPEQSRAKPGVYRPSAKLPLTSMSLEAIAHKLFEDYLTYYQAPERAAGERINSYKIEQVKFVKQNEGSFITEITFSVQPLQNESMWTAGNGKLGKDNWIEHKTVFATYTVKDDVYTLESISTSP